METFQYLPEWFGAAVIGAVVAAVGYVAKLILSWWDEALSNYRENKASLVELSSLLFATKVAFNYQKEIRNRLHKLLKERDNQLVQGGGGYERHFSNAHSSMTKDELELHSIIQAYTIYALYPLNKEILNWMKKDTFYKSKKWRLKSKKVLSEQLSNLEGHLLLWVAKYQMWMPDQANHALVYLADENKHGLGFPTGIENDIKEAVDKTHWLFG